MKRTEDRKRVVHKALSTLLDSINYWPMKWKDFEKLVKEIDDKFY